VCTCQSGQIRRCRHQLPQRDNAIVAHLANNMLDSVPRAVVLTEEQLIVECVKAALDPERADGDPRIVHTGSR
jgi:hypothetical protein